MRFIHCADCHIDGFRDSTLSDLGFKSFIYVIDYALEKQVDFFLIAGDLFNSALPRIDALKATIKQLKRLAQQNIPVYFIPGSHDFSPQGRTMLDIIELAGLGINVMKGKVNAHGLLELETTVDTKTGAQLVGIHGRRGMLDRQEYADLAPLQISKEKPSVFLFHTLINELKTSDLENVDGTNIDLLPAGFDYYAGGHIHIVKSFSNPTYKNVVYPGPTFPNSFSELETLRGGSFVHYDSKKNFGEANTIKNFKHISIPSKEVASFSFDATNKPAHLFQEESIEELAQADLDNKIVLLRFSGQLNESKTHDVDFKAIMQECYAQGAFVVLKNSHKLSGQSFVEVASTSEDAVELEQDTITDHLGQVALPTHLNEEEIIKELINTLDVDQFDGEKKTTFVERVQTLAKNIVEKE